jgi:hypothetical protein
MVAIPDVDSRPSEVLRAAKPLKAAGIRLEPTASASEMPAFLEQCGKTPTKVRSYSDGRAAEGKQSTFP